MAAIDFPSSPSTNQVFSINGTTWIYDGVSWQNINLTNASYIITAGTVAIPSGASSITSTVTASAITSVPRITNTQTISYSAAGTYSVTAPWGTNYMQLYIVGGGGGGGSNLAGGLPGGGGGGGAGGILMYAYGIKPGDTISGIVLGAGGTGGAGGQNPGGTGGTSSLTFRGITYTATGGAGGQGGNASGGVGGAGGSASISGTTSFTALGDSYGSGLSGGNGSSFCCNPTGGGGGQNYGGYFGSNGGGGGANSDGAAGAAGKLQVTFGYATTNIGTY